MVYFTSDPDITLSANFRKSEFVSRDGFPIVIIDDTLVKRLQALRDYLQKPVIINSAYRSPEHNKKVGGAAKSRHMIGCAADIHVKGLSTAELSTLARRAGFSGVIEYPNDGFVHVDVGRGTPYYDVVK